MDPRPFDAVLLVSFGGPERPEDVVPFLENVTSGRGIPRERLEEVGAHYKLFGGKSPINELNLELLEALRKDFADHGLHLPIYWGNRNWDPYLREAARQMEADGITHAACFVTSAYSSYSGCRQYREDLFDAAHGIDIKLSRLRHYFDPPALRLDLDRPYRFRMLAADVTHGASIQFGEGARMIRLGPGAETELQMTFTRPGSFLVYCTSYCGPGHDGMQARITVA